jgi:AcrR family transcriptional regulator
MPVARERNNQTGAGARRSLTAEDWVDAALTAIGEGGLAAVAVEPIAKRLGATKGSFYWHFANREALIEGALARWESQNTERVIAAVDATRTDSTAEQRLRQLFKEVPAATSGDPVEVALLANARHPQVAPVLHRVTERRLAYVSDVFTDLGFPPAEARRRGLMVYTVHLGQISLIHGAPQVLPASKRDRKHYMDTLVYTLTRRD